MITENSNELPPCNPDVFEHGVSVGLFDLPKNVAEHICQSFSAALDIPVDWHYIAGRVHIKALLNKPEVESSEEVENVGN